MVSFLVCLPETDYGIVKFILRCNIIRFAYNGYHECATTCNHKNKKL